jgi:hypothetical protein
LKQALRLRLLKIQPHISAYSPGFGHPHFAARPATPAARDSEGGRQTKTFWIKWSLRLPASLTVPGRRVATTVEVLAAHVHRGTCGACAAAICGNLRESAAD